MKKFAKPFKTPPKSKTGPTTISPPPPPPLKFNVIIAQVYGPTANIYRDIFAVSPTASHQELKEAYLNKRKQTQVKLDKISSSNRKSILKTKERSKAKQKELLEMQMNAISEAYKIVIDPQKKTDYDISIGLKEPVSEISFDCHAGQFPGDEQPSGRGAIDITSAHHIDLSSRMKEYLKDKQSDEGRSRTCSDDYDIITTKGDPDKKVQFTLESLGGPPSPEPDESKKVPIVSPTSAEDNALSKKTDDDISPMARVRQNKEQSDSTLADVFASYLNMNNFISVVKESEDDERTNHTDSYTVGEDDWSSDGTVKVSHCRPGFGSFGFAEDLLSRATSIVADGFCQ